MREGRNRSRKVKEWWNLRKKDHEICLALCPLPFPAAADEGVVGVVSAVVLASLSTTDGRWPELNASKLKRSSFHHS